MRKRCPAREWAGGIAFVLGGLLACDPKSGLESAVGAVNPADKSYLDGPGLQLVTGPYDHIGIDLNGEAELHLFARRRDDAGQSLTLFGQNAESSCAIAPNAQMWFPSKPTSKPYRLLPYLEGRDDSGVGTLRFARIDCQVEDYSVSQVSAVFSDAPYGPDDVAFEAGFVVMVGTSLVLADPWTATTRVLASDYRHLGRPGQIGTPRVIWGDSQIIVYDNLFNELARFGKHVSAVSPFDSGDARAVLDDDGLHYMRSTISGALYDFPVVDPDACGLNQSFAQSGWVLLHSPCNDPHLVAEQVADPNVHGVSPVTPTAPAERRVFEAQADFGPVRMAFPLTIGDGSQVAAFFLEDVDPETGLGTLFAVKQDGDPVRVGSNATLPFSLLNIPGSPWAGLALVDVQGGIGRTIRWSWAGASETLAENVLVNAPISGILANYNGHSGDLEMLLGDMLWVDQVGAPPFDSSLGTFGFRWVLRLERYDGTVGDLMFDDETLPTPRFRLAGKRVPAQGYRFLRQVPLPGFAYISGYDEQTLTGTLFAQNVDLGSTGVVADGVSDFTPSHFPAQGILYAVPRGDNAGIWFARAK